MILCFYMEFKIIEKKWKKTWEVNNLFQNIEIDQQKKKYYILDMFPYPSGQGLHVGHPKGYIATDIFSRFIRMRGYNVLHPMGWDAFGLPAENYAIKTGIHPAIITKDNIQRYKEQINALALSYDWSKEIDTTDPAYYRWTQWIFLKLFEKGLAYIAETPINWCPSCKTGLANEEVEQGRCARCQTETTRKNMKQWMLKITAYAESLLEDLDLVDWPEPIKLMQRNWIGKSEGAEIKFLFEGESNKGISVFTTRIDTIFGVTALVVAPEHPLVSEHENKIKNYSEVKKYIEAATKKSELERIELNKEKTGVKLEGIFVINPLTEEKIQVWVGDYVIASYGGGAVMVVPAHDQRDFDFAERYQIPIKEVVQNQNKKVERGTGNELLEAFEQDGVLINSGGYSGLSSASARKKLAQELETKKMGGPKIHYRFRDWVFSRQRYWGEPFPLVFCEHCREKILSGDYKDGKFSQGEITNPGWVALPEESLPLELPETDTYQPTGTGESPLANIQEWVITKCPKCGGPGKRETNTMPNWAGSSWYYLRYADPKNNHELISQEKEKYWQPVDLYVGGAEHAVLHLLYARFWHKFLYDLGVVHSKEPFMKLKNQGMILGDNGAKMSKSLGNVVNPDDIIAQYSCDIFRTYEMFMGPFEGSSAWNTASINGVYRFLTKVSDLISQFGAAATSGPSKFEQARHSIIKKVTEDISDFKFNTVVSSLMEYTTKLEKGEASQDDLKTLVLLLAPFAPHLAEELWHIMNPRLAERDSVFMENWPVYDAKMAQSDEVEIVVQINGKFRASLKLTRNMGQAEVEKIALTDDKVKKFIDGKNVRKVIFVQNKIINLVV